MNESTHPVSDLDRRRRRAQFRSWHRGMRELDLILGSFADRMIGRLNRKEIEQYEALLEVPDSDLLRWINRQAPVPAPYDTPMFEKILAFRQDGQP